MTVRTYSKYDHWLHNTDSVKHQYCYLVTLYQHIATYNKAVSIQIWVVWLNTSRIDISEYQRPIKYEYDISKWWEI